MASIDKTQLQIETVILMGLLLGYGVNRISPESMVVVLLFVIAAMLSMLKYRVNQQARGET